jgi:hypothetical protein
MRERPKIENDEPKRPKLLRDNVAPKCKKSRTAIADPRRAKLRRDKEEPKCTYPITEMLLDPKLNLPKTDKAEPIRAKVRSDNDEPRRRKSNTASDEPKRP